MNIDDWQNIQAAQGWTELGLFNEAADALGEVSESAKEHPEFLQTCWRIYAEFGRWTECWNIARTILAEDPANAMGHILFACAIENLRGVQDAYDYLRPVADRITDSITIHFNLACYSCGLGRLDEARTWLAVAFEASEADSSLYGLFYRHLARDDEAFKLLWPEISEIGRPVESSFSRPLRGPEVVTAYDTAKPRIG
jgi:predicted Zn-dependent protease